VAAKKPLTAGDRSRAIRIALQGVAAGVDFADLARQLEVLHPKNDSYPGEVFLELGADAFEEGGISRDQPVDYEGIRERYLPERQFRGPTEHHRSHYALGAAAMLRAGSRRISSARSAGGIPTTCGSGRCIHSLSTYAWPQSVRASLWR
jgi:hypothetical protein